MLDPQHVRLQVQSGEIPAHWRLIHGSISFRTHLKLSVFQFVGVIVFISAFEDWLGLFVRALRLDFTFIYIYTPIYFLTSIFSFFLRANMAKNAALILLPEGCMVLLNMNDNTYTCKYLWYASIADMQLRTSFWLGPYLAIKYYDGTKQKWYPNPLFGRRARTIQDVLTDYTLYQMRKSAYLSQ